MTEYQHCDIKGPCPFDDVECEDCKHWVKETWKERVNRASKSTGGEKMAEAKKKKKAEQEKETEPLEGLSEEVKEDLEKLETKEEPKQETFEVEKVQGQVTLTGQPVKVHVTHDGGTTKTTFKFSGGEGKISISDAEYRKRCLPKKTKKGKVKKAEITPRVLVARKLRFPGITHTPQGDEYVQYVDAFEPEVKKVFKNLKE